MGYYCLRRRGFSLIEIVVVMSLLSVLLLIIAATLWGAIKIERADAAVLHRVTVQSQLADQFREDVGRAVECPDSVRDLTTGPDCLILRVSDDRHVVYRWSNERLVRHEIAGTTETTLNFPVGNEHIDVQFVPPKLDSRLVTMRLIESRGVGTSRRSWPLEISASLGSDLQ